MLLATVESPDLGGRRQGRAYLARRHPLPGSPSRHGRLAEKCRLHGREAEFRGHGVAYCATCDGEFFTGREVFVVGGGFAAAEEAPFLTTYASHVTIRVYTDDFTCAKATADAAYANDKITVQTNAHLLGCGR